VALPFVTSRYGGPSPHLRTIRGEPSDLDDGTYHGALQDFHVAVRFNVRSRPLAITPFAEAIIPSHHYESLGHSTVGLDLRALVVGVTAGGFVDAVPEIYYQAQLSHAIVQQVLGIRPNRSRVESEVGYFVTPRFAVRFLESFQFTHDGWDFIQPAGPPVDPFARIHSRPDDPITIEIRRNHDRLMRSNFVNLGGGFIFGATDSMDIFAALATTVWGENIHPHKGLSVGANWHFRTRRGAAQPSAPQMRPRGFH
jgi:hypothetical protein